MWHLVLHEGLSPFKGQNVYTGSLLRMNVTTIKGDIDIIFQAAKKAVSAETTAARKRSKQTIESIATKKRREHTSAARKRHSAESIAAKKSGEMTSEDEENATPPKRRKPAKPDSAACAAAAVDVAAVAALRKPKSPVKKRAALPAKAASHDTMKPSWKDAPAFLNSVQPVPITKQPRKRPSPEKSGQQPVMPLKQSSHVLCVPG